MATYDTWGGVTAVSKTGCESLGGWVAAATVVVVGGAFWKRSLLNVITRDFFWRLTGDKLTFCESKTNKLQWRCNDSVKRVFSASSQTNQPVHGHKTCTVSLHSFCCITLNATVIGATTGTVQWFQHFYSVHCRQACLVRNWWKQHSEFKVIRSVGKN